jgi:RNA polymerase sigma-70 factor (ECF subfamily)
LELAQWIEAHYASVHKTLVGACYKLLGNEPDAEDAAQQTIFEAMRDSARFRGECEPIGYLVGIAKRQCFHALRRQRREPAILDDDENTAAFAIRDRHSAAAGQEAGILGLEMRKLLRRTIRRIPNQRQRQIARLAWVYGRSDEEIARILDLAEGSLRNEKHRAKQAILEIFPRVQKWRRPVLGDCAVCGESARLRCSTGLLCLRCSSAVHGATRALIEARAAPKLDQGNTCQYCGKPWSPLRRGRCEACYQRWKKNGFEDKPSTRRPGYGKCACGCGEKMNPRESRRGCIYRPGHVPARRLCACGCGTEIPQFDTRGRERRFYPRHGRRKRKEN